MLTDGRYHSTDASHERHTRRHPCPICCGDDGMPRGKNKRCHGYTVAFDDGHRLAYCARNESDIPHPSQELWGHRLDGEPSRHASGNGGDAERPRQRVAEYEYTDRHGEPIARKVRYEPKNFAWEVPDGRGGWRSAQRGDGNPRTLYRLPEVVEAEVVHLHEGEKAADALAEILPPDHASTCIPVWSSELPADMLEPLRGKTLVDWVDRDDEGIKKARKLAQILPEIAVAVGFVQSATMGEHDDAYDHVAADYKLADAVPIEIRADTDHDCSDTERVRPLVQRASDVTVTPIEWIWRGYLPRKKVIVFDGLPGVAKSTIMTDVSARVTSGKLMPDDAPGMQGNVVMISYEDDPADTIVPRFLAAGGDPDRLHLLDSVQTSDGLEFLCVPDHVAALEHLVYETDAVLVVIDPIMAALGPGVKTGIDHDVRRALAPLTALAQRTSAAVVIVRHLNKAANITDPVLRGGGSIGIIGAARHALMAGRDPDEPERRVLAVTKSNIGRDDVSSLSYRVVEDPEYRVSAIEWLGRSNRSARDLLEADAGNESRTARDEATSILQEFLADGPQLAHDCKTYMKEAGGSQLQDAGPGQEAAGGEVPARHRGGREEALVVGAALAEGR